MKILVVAGVPSGIGKIVSTDDVSQEFPSTVTSAKNPVQNAAALTSSEESAVQTVARLKGESAAVLLSQDSFVALRMSVQTPTHVPE